MLTTLLAGLMAGPAAAGRLPAAARPAPVGPLPAATGPRTVTAAGDDSFPPFEFVDASGQYRGFNVDILQAVALQTGLEVRWVPMPWSEVLTALEEGRVDVIQGIKFLPERARRVRFTEPYLTTAHALFVRAENQVIHGLGDLEGARVAVQRGDFGHSLLSGRPGVRLVPVENQERALDLLLAGEVDAFLGNRLTGIYFLQRKQAAGRVKIVGEPINPAEYGFAVRRDDAELQRILDAGLRAIRENGTYDQIYRKWFGEFVDRPPPWVRQAAAALGLVALAALGATLLTVRWNQALKREVARRTGEIERISHLNAAILRSVPAAVVTVDAAGVILAANAAAQELAAACHTGPPPDLVGQPLHTTPLAACLDPADLAAALAGVRGCHDREWEVPAGHRVRVYRYSIGLLQSGQGGAVMVISDITAERELARQRVHSEKLQALGRLVAGLAHEIRNPLMALQNFAELLPARYHDPEFRTIAARYIPQEIRRINLLISDLLDSARPRPPAPGPCDVAESVRAVLALMAARIARYGATVVTDLPPGLVAWVDAGQFRQVLINLLLNALQAVPAGSGRVTVRALPARGGVEITVADNGPGIPPGDLPRVFEPFFTRRPDGTGLGLYLSYQFTRENGGEIAIHSPPTGGTEVRLWFPGPPVPATGDTA